MPPKPKHVPDPYLSERGKLAYAHRPGASAEERAKARSRWNGVWLEHQIREVLAAEHPVSPEQRLHLAVLLTSGGDA